MDIDSAGHGVAAAPNARKSCKEELAKIRCLDDFDLTVLISEVHDHGWPTRARFMSSEGTSRVSVGMGLDSAKNIPICPTIDDIL